jgi:hypothetical protein
VQPKVIAVLRRAFKLAGVEFIDENGGGPGAPSKDREREAWKIVDRDCTTKREQRFEPGSIVGVSSKKTAVVYIRHP